LLDRGILAGVSRKRFANLQRIEALDPEVDWLEIYRLSAMHEFPWDYTRALELALFRTFAVPFIGDVLDRSGEFSERTQRRYDDTAILLGEVLEHGPDSERGRAAIRRINRQHGQWSIPNEYMIYVLSTFVVVPARWLDRFGWRPLHANERQAAYRYYARLGELMGIREVPPSYDELVAWSDAYEAAEFGRADGGRRTADATLNLFASWQPSPLRRFSPTLSRALMDERLREALGYAAAPAAAERMVTAALRTRARVERLLPPRRRPALARESRYIRSYPSGYEIDDLGPAVTTPSESSTAPR
jgi:hypothetical protein